MIETSKDLVQKKKRSVVWPTKVAKSIKWRRLISSWRRPTVPRFVYPTSLIVSNKTLILRNTNSRNCRIFVSLRALYGSESITLLTQSISQKLKNKNRKFSSKYDLTRETWIWIERSWTVKQLVNTIQKKDLNWYVMITFTLICYDHQIVLIIINYLSI